MGEMGEPTIAAERGVHDTPNPWLEPAMAHIIDFVGAQCSQKSFQGKEG